MTLLKILREVELPYTVHSFRSAFRDWVAEETESTREVAEAALAHTVESKVEAAYRRTDYFHKRRLLMEEWAAPVTAPRTGRAPGRLNLELDRQWKNAPGRIEALVRRAGRNATWRSGSMPMHLAGRRGAIAKGIPTPSSPSRVRPPSDARF